MGPLLPFCCVRVCLQTEFLLEPQRGQIATFGKARFLRERIQRGFACRGI